jgi:hypothetical protein
MAKISDNLSLKRSREPNHSFMNSEDMFLKSSKSASASISEIGPCLYKYDSKCLTTKFQASSINTNNLTYNQERRPFFEDQYAWLTNQYDPSTTQYPIYYGSGTLASNEYPYAGLLSTGLGYAMDISAAILNGNHGRKIDEFQSNMFGNVRRQFKLNTFELSKNLNGAIDWWNTRLNASDSLEDGIFISHRGTGWGRQMFLDPTFYEGYGLNADNGLLSRLLGGPQSHLSQKHIIIFSLGVLAATMLFIIMVEFLIIILLHICLSLTDKMQYQYTQKIMKRMINTM